MTSKAKRFLAAAAVAANLAVALPAAAVPTGALAVDPCRADVGQSSDEAYQTMYVTGALAPAGATHVWLTCGIVQNGETVAYVGEATEDVDVPVAVVLGTATVPAGPLSSCYDATVLYSERYEYYDTCP